VVSGTDTLRAGVAGTIVKGTLYDVEVQVSGNLATLKVGGVMKTSYTFDGIQGGQVGLRIAQAHTHFKEVYLRAFSQVTKYYTFGGRPIAMRRDHILFFLAGDHLGTVSVVLDAAGNVVDESRHYPYGTERWPEDGTFPTDYRFTGQLLESSLGLYQMGARRYDRALGRWVSPDTLIPVPRNPQSLNRYSYCLGNPLKFVDPSGYLSQDEIMQYFGVETWDEVLALFGEFAEFAGQWGFLATLGAAHVGDRIDIYDASGDCTAEHCKVQIIAQEELKDCDGKVCGFSVSADAVKQAAYFEHSRYEEWGARGEWISQGRYGAGIPHLHFDASKVDWIDVAASQFGLVGLAPLPGSLARYYSMANLAAQGAEAVRLGVRQDWVNLFPQLLSVGASIGRGLPFVGVPLSLNALVNDLQAGIVPGE
jgi:RHS repeat-associated protein